MGWLHWILLNGERAGQVFARQRHFFRAHRVAGLAEQGIGIIGNTPALAAQFFQSELIKHASLFKRSGYRLTRHLGTSLRYLQYK